MLDLDQKDTSVDARVRVGKEMYLHYIQALKRQGFRTATEFGIHKFTKAIGKVRSSVDNLDSRPLSLLP